MDGRTYLNNERSLLKIKKFKNYLLKRYEDKENRKIIKMMESQDRVSCSPYSDDWTETLKRSIRERDNYTCQICGECPALHIHHIDYNKNNCHPFNLVTLCYKCHSKTNHNREKWDEFFAILVMNKHREWWAQGLLPSQKEYK